MDKQDILYVVAGIVIVLVLAFIVKPAITGEETSLNLWGEENGEEEVYEEIPAETMEMLPTASPPPSTPVPTPTWSGAVQSLSFVDPSIYDVEFPTPVSGIEPPYSPPPVTTWVTYMTLDGSTSGTTDIFSIPFSKWKIKYAVKPMNPEFATFDLMIKDAMDPNRYIGEINVVNYQFVKVPDWESVEKIEVELSGGEVAVQVWDESLGAYVFPASVYDDPSTLEDYRTRLTSDSEESSSSGTSSGGIAYGSGEMIEFEDPNSDIGSIKLPQNVVPSSITVEDSMTIREGDREYYFIITAQVIDSYKIEIEVPST